MKKVPKIHHRSTPFIMNETFSNNISKVLVIGDASVGKSSLVRSLSQTQYTSSSNTNTNATHLHPPRVLTTNSVYSVTEKSIPILLKHQQQEQHPADTIVTLRLTDLHTISIPDPLLSQIFSSTIITLILFDLTSQSSFTNACNEYTQLAKEFAPTSGIILVGTSFDLNLVRAVNDESIEEFIKRENILFLEVCCKDEEGEEGENDSGVTGVTGVGVDLLLNLIMLEIEGLLNIDERDLYNLYNEDDYNDSVGEGEGDNNNNASDEAENLLKDKLVASFGKLKVENRVFDSVSSIIGSFSLPDSEDDSDESDDSDDSNSNNDGKEKEEIKDEDPLTTSIENLQRVVESLSSRSKITLQQQQQTTNAEIKDISNQTLQEAYVILGRANPKPPPPKRRTKGKPLPHPLPPPNKAEQQKNAFNLQPELRINIGVPSGMQATIEIYKTDEVEAVAKKFMKQHKIPLNQDSVTRLVEQIEKCRANAKDVAESELKQVTERKERKQISNSNSNANGNTSSRLSGNSKVLGRMEIVLNNGQSRSLVLRVGDVPAVIVKQFAARHLNLVSEEEMRRVTISLNQKMKEHKRALRG